MNSRLNVQTIYFEKTAQKVAYGLGSELYELLNRRAQDPLAFGSRIKVDVAVRSQNVNPRTSAVTHVMIPVLGSIDFQQNREPVIRRLNEWNDDVTPTGEPRTGCVLPVLLSEVWRNAESELPVKPLLTELCGNSNCRRKTIDEIVLSIARVLGGNRSAARLFVSHSKRDLDATRNAAQSIHEHVVTDTTGRAFFDVVELESGKPLVEQIDDAASRGLLIAIRSDSYSSRTWCQRELLTAKKHGLPTLTVEVLQQGEPRASPYGGNGRSIVWNDNAAQVVSLAMVEWVKAANFRAVVAQITEQADLPAETVSLARPPELLDMAQGLLSATQSQLVLHPDPELSVFERNILAAANPRLRLITPTTAFRRSLGRHRSNVSAPLDQIRVAFSLSESPDTDGPQGFTKHHVVDVAVQLARALVSVGAKLAYGGDFSQLHDVNLTEILAQLIVDYNQTASERAEFLTSFQSADVDLMKAGDLPITIYHLAATEAKRDAIVPPPTAEAERSQQRPLHLSDLRRAMTRRTDARIALGGKTEPKTKANPKGYSGRMPGIIEEAWRSLQTGQPLYLLGGFGGAAGLVAELLASTSTATPAVLRDETWSDDDGFNRVIATVNDSAHRSRLELPERMEDVGTEIRERGLGFLADDETSLDWNGLSVEENRELFRSRDPLRLTSLVMKGLLHIHRQRAKGKLEIELVRGSIVNARQLDAIAIATFENVPLGGAGAVLDEAIGGHALSQANPEALVHVEHSSVDANWLYIASLGAMDNVGELTQHVRAAAAETATLASRHGFHRLGVVTFGGSLGAGIDELAAAMLAGFHNLAGHTTLHWFETDEGRYAELTRFLKSQQDVSLTTRVVEENARPRVVGGETLILQVTSKGDRVSVTVLPPSGTAIVPVLPFELTKQQIEEFTRGSGYEGRSAPTIEQLNERGPKLTRLLLGEECEQIIAQCGDARITIIHDRESSRLPFEIMATATAKLATKHGIHRRLAVPEAPAKSIFARPPKSGKLAVALVVNPTADLAGTEEEANSVRAALDQFKNTIEVSELRRGKATEANVQDALAEADVFHYCGHAFFDGPGPENSGLHLADGKLTLADLREAAALPRVVFFNACEAGRVRGDITTEAEAFGELVLRSGVEAYLGTYWWVRDKSAAEFAANVYSCLATGETLDVAVKEARNALLKLDQPDWANYILYGEGEFTLKRKISD